MARKIAVVLSYRGAYARLKSFLRRIKEHPSLELQLIVSGSALLEKYGEAVNNIKADGFDIASQLNFVLEGTNPSNMAKTAGMGILEMATTLDKLRPNVVVVIGDRYETLGTAASAAYMNIPLVHVQGGEITGSIGEKVRHAITKLADLHFVATAGAKERVERMGEDPSTVFVTGCPSIDLVIECINNGKMEQLDLTRRRVGATFEVQEDNYLVVLQHPVTTEYGEAHEQIQETLMAVNDLQMPTFWFWPNVDAGSDGLSKGICVFREKHNPQLIHFFKNMAPERFYRLLNKSTCLVGSSSVGIRECSFLGLPVVNIGSRQSRRERGPNVMDIPHDRAMIKEAIRHQIAQGRYPSVTLYGDGKAGDRMSKLLTEVSLKIGEKSHTNGATSRNDQPAKYIPASVPKIRSPVYNWHTGVCLIDRWAG